MGREGLGALIKGRIFKTVLNNIGDQSLSAFSWQRINQQIVKI